MNRIERNFLLLVLTFAVLLSFLGFLAFRQVTEHVIESWGQQIADIQVRFNSSRLLQPLEREIALAEQMARAPTLIQWARNPDDVQLREAAMRELESFRQNFQSQSYFIALTSTLDYYHNNAENEYLGQELRYQLRPDRPADAWFFKLAEEGRDFHININPDVELGVTKLWIDILMRDVDGQILAVLGTGLPLESVINESVQPNQKGIKGLFVDSTGAIQLYQDRRLIDYASFVQPEGQKRTVDLIVDLPGDGRELLAIMESLRASPEGKQKIATQFVTIQGERHLAGVAYLPSLDWFDVTFLNLTEIMPLKRFWPIAVLLFIALVLTLFLLHYALRREILGPLQTLIGEMENFGRVDGKYPTPLPQVYQGELGRVFDQFQKMAVLVQTNTSKLEAMVQERTKELEAKAREDGLTGLLNRTAMTEALNTEAERCARTQDHYGIIWIDIDTFKSVNDTYGHPIGDQILRELARVLKDDLRPYDHAARWGGDEFLILLAPCDDAQLEKISNRLRVALAACKIFEQYGVTVSTGAAISSAHQSVEDIIGLADDALYKAKAEGGDASHFAA